MSDCVFCKDPKKVGQYICPKCNAPYCSLNCYRSTKHSECSEKFYKDCVEEEMSLRHSEDKKNPKGNHDKMMEILQRVRNLEVEADEDELDSDDDADLSERLEGIDLNDTDKVWSKLTRDERNEFESLVRTGDIAKMVPEYQPWWCSYDNKLVSDITGGPEGSKYSNVPDIDLSIPDFKVIMARTKPSKIVKYGLLNVLYAYAYGVKYFTGSHIEDENIFQFVNMLLKLSDNLGEKEANFDDADSSLESAASNVNIYNEFGVSGSFTRETKKDVIMIIRGPNRVDKSLYILAALSDLKRCLCRCSKLLKKPVNRKLTSDSNSKQDLPPWRGQNSYAVSDLSNPSVKKAMKKIEFYQSWTSTYFCEFDFNFANL